MRDSPVARLKPSELSKWHGTTLPWDTPRHRETSL